MTEVTFEYKLMFDNTWLYNYASFTEQHSWHTKPSQHDVRIPDLFTVGFLKHWTLDEGFSAIYNSYIQKADVRYRINSEQEAAYYYIYFDLSESAGASSFGNTASNAGTYMVHYGMSGADKEFVVHNNQRAHGLQLLIKPEVFEEYFTHSQDTPENISRLRSALDPANFNGHLPIDSQLVLALMQLPKHVNTEELDIYYTRSYVYNILSRFLHSLLSSEPPEDVQHLSGICRLIEVNEEIAENLDDEQPSLEEAARLSCMCATKFKKLFRIAYNTTYHKYHQRIRMVRAKELFQFSNASVTTVVHELGYKNAGHFARLFKEQFSISPKEYQQQFDTVK